MKISLCSPMSISYYGGAEKQICQIAHLFHDGGHEVEVHALPYAYTGRKVQVEKVLNTPYYEDWRHTVLADVTYVYYQPFYWRLFSIKGIKIAGMHSIETFHPIPFYSRKYLAFKMIGYPDLASFDIVRTLNPALSVKHQDVRYVPDWVDLKIYKPLKSKSEIFTLLYVGRHTEWKGWPVFKRVCHRLKAMGYNFTFKCTGKGDELIKGLGVVTNEMASIYSESHLLVHPSQADTFGLAIVESLACGTPVVTTPISEHKALKLPLFYAWNVDEFLDTVLKIYNKWSENRNWYNKLCILCRKTVEKYDVKEVFASFEDLFFQVARGSNN